MKKIFVIVTITAFCSSLNRIHARGIFNKTGANPAMDTSVFTDAAAFGFLPTETGVTNTKALQAAMDGGGTITVS